MHAGDRGENRCYNKDNAYFCVYSRLLLHSMLLTAYSCLVYGDAA